jgi:hypothetical protein
MFSYNGHVRIWRILDQRLALTSFFDTSGSCWFPPKDKLPKWWNLLTSLLTCQWRSGCHVSITFLNYVYLKFQLDLDTCHHLIAPSVLADVVLLAWISWCGTCPSLGYNSHRFIWPLDPTNVISSRWIVYIHFCLWGFGLFVPNSQFSRSEIPEIKIEKLEFI